MIWYVRSSKLLEIATTWKLIVCVDDDDEDEDEEDDFWANLNVVYANSAAAVTTAIESFMFARKV